MSKYKISNSDKYIDAQDVRKRIEELEDELSLEENEGSVKTFFELSDEDWEDSGKETKESLFAEWEERTGMLKVERDDLEILQAFAREIGDDNLQHGCQLIHEDHFEEHAREIAGDLYGKEVREAKWPFYCIDWTKAAEELKVDYTGADFDGVTYYFR